MDENLTKEVETMVAGALDKKNADLVSAIETAVENKMKALKEEIQPKITVGDDRAIQDKTFGFKSISDFASAVAKADRSHGKVYDERLDTSKKAQKSITDLGISVDADGGYLVPPEHSNQVMKIALEKTDIFQRCTKVPMATNSIDFPYFNETTHASTVRGGIRFYWGDEGEQRTSAQPSFGRLSLKLKKAMGMVYVTEELLSDSPVSMEPLLREGFAESMAWTLDDAIINGNGSNQPLGILNAPCLVAQAIESGQDADTIVTENVVKMYSRLYSKRNGVWLVNHDTFPQLAMLNISGGTGTMAVFVPAGNISGQPFNTLLGLPIVYTEHCDTVGDQGDIILADLSQYLIGQKVGAQLDFASSMHLRFDYDENVFKYTFRLDGEPWWPSALTTQYSSNTLSPFVALAARA